MPTDPAATPLPSLDRTLALIAANGFLVSNLFQRDDGQWQANIRTATHATEFGLGDSPAEALTDSLVKHRVPLAAIPALFSIAPANRPSLASLFKLSGTTTVRRRV